MVAFGERGGGGMSAPGRAPASNDSKGISALRALFAALAAAGAGLLIGAEFTPLLHLTTPAGVVGSERVGAHHAYAQLIIGIVALGMAWVALEASSRSALLALAALGVAAVLIALLGDLPAVRSSGLIGPRLQSARASAQIGFYLETAGAAVLIVAAGLGLLMPAAPARAAASRRRSAGAQPPDRAGA
jgi:hypothetical protein